MIFLVFQSEQCKNLLGNELTECQNAVANGQIYTPRGDGEIQPTKTDTEDNQPTEEKETEVPPPQSDNSEEDKVRFEPSKCRKYISDDYLDAINQMREDFGVGPIRETFSKVGLFDNQIKPHVCLFSHAKAVSAEVKYEESGWEKTNIWGRSIAGWCTSEGHFNLLMKYGEVRCYEDDCPDGKRRSVCGLW